MKILGIEFFSMEYVFLSLSITVLFLVIKVFFLENRLDKMEEEKK